MTNFEKIVQGGPEALVAYHRMYCKGVCVENGNCSSKNCVEGRIRWLNSTERPELSIYERAIVDAMIDIGLYWAARNRDGTLTFFNSCPRKDAAKPCWITHSISHTWTGATVLRFIMWDDTVATNLRELMD